MVRFDVTSKERKLIEDIATRAVRLASTNDRGRYLYMDAEMDITAVHANGCRLRLAEMLAADDFNFAHDIFGIQGHLDRSTGKLNNHFLPRFSESQS